MIHGETHTQNSDMRVQWILGKKFTVNTIHVINHLFVELDISTFHYQINHHGKMVIDAGTVGNTVKQNNTALTKFESYFYGDKTEVQSSDLYPPQ